MYKLRIALLMVLSVVTLSIQSQNRKAIFPGGQKALAHFINLRWDGISYYEGNDAECPATICLKIEKNGIPSIYKLLKSFSSSDLSKARKIVSQMPRWKPALRNGKPVVSYITLQFPMGKITPAYLSQLYREGVVCRVCDSYPDYIPTNNKSLNEQIDSYLGPLKKKWRGRVVISFIVNKDGSLSNAQIQRSSNNNAYLDKKVLEAVKRT